MVGVREQGGGPGDRPEGAGQAGPTNY